MAKKIKPPASCGGSSLVRLAKLVHEDVFDQVQELRLKVGDRMVSRWPGTEGTALRWIDYRLMLVGYREEYIPIWITDRRDSLHNTFAPVDITWCDLRNCIWWKIIP